MFMLRATSEPPPAEYFPSISSDATRILFERRAQEAEEERIDRIRKNKKHIEIYESEAAKSFPRITCCILIFIGKKTMIRKKSIIWLLILSTTPIASSNRKYLPSHPLSLSLLRPARVSHSVPLSPT